MSPVADNYVQIRIKASDTAKPDLDELKLKLDELGNKVASAKVSVDDEVASEKLLRLNARLAELNQKVANPRIKVAGAARAAADILMVEHQLDKLKAKADSSGPGGLLGRLFSGIGGAGSKIGGIGSSISGAGGGTLFTNPYSLAAIAGGITALLPELTGLISGFAAAGAGAGSFYLLAHPAISNLTQDTQNLLTAEQALQKAQNLEAADPTKAHAKGVTTALDNLKAIQMGMGQDAGGAAAGIAKLRAEYEKLTSAFQPEVFKVFNAGLKLANTLLPDVVPFARTFADVLATLLGQASKFAGSKGFSDWLKQFHGIEGPALAAIGKGIGEVVVQFGKLLTTMSAKDVVNSINIAFSVLSGTIDGLRHVVEAIMRAWDVSSKTIARDARQVSAAFDALRHDIANWGHDIASYFDEARANIARWAADVQRDADNVVRWFQALPGRIVHGLGDMKNLLKQAGIDVVTGFIKGIESMFGAVADAAWGMVKSLGSKVLHVLGIGSPSKVAAWWGQMVAQGMAEGIASNARLPADAAARMARGVSSGLGSGAAAGGAAGGGTVRVQLEWVGGDSALFTAMRQGIRVRGGNVQTVLGHGR